MRRVRCARTVIKRNLTDRPNVKTPGLVGEEEAHVMLRVSGIGEAHSWGQVCEVLNQNGGPRAASQVRSQVTEETWLT